MAKAGQNARIIMDTNLPLMPSITAKPRRPLGQKISLAISAVSYAAAAACGIGALLYTANGDSDPVHASLMAAVVFFIGCGVVLQVIGTARLNGVLSGSGEHDHE